ncbi:hypothetical protein [Paraburkholderia sp. J10-1]|uniref:hypothetical protein n=1 Tax=Paraburkholderia sp. J10-1 TaxID=2805430 RepID=UPI002AB77DCB|nr:hypothetical protein [Paraburkholderia sp. J10-1]
MNSKQMRYTRLLVARADSNRSPVFWGETIVMPPAHQRSAWRDRLGARAHEANCRNMTTRKLSIFAIGLRAFIEHAVPFDHLEVVLDAANRRVLTCHREQIAATKNP